MILALGVILVALVFEYINGFHDSANSIATVVSTKVLSPRQAIVLAASMDLLGALLGTAVAKTITSGLIDNQVLVMTSGILVCALIAAILWNLVTWWFGLPSRSSHALIGGDVDQVGAERAETVFERGAGLIGGESRFLCGRGDCAGGLCEPAFECGNALQNRAGDTTGSPHHSAPLGGSYAVLRGDGDAGVACAELSETALRFSVTVHGSDVKVANARIIRGLHEAKTLTAAERAHDGRATVPEPSCLAAAGCEPDLFHDASASRLGYRLVRCSSLTREKICKADGECEYRVGGVGEAGGRKDGSAADVDVARAVEEQVGRDHAVAG